MDKTLAATSASLSTNDMLAINPNATCPCGSKKKYNECCQIIHRDLTQITNLKQLVQARYAAFVHRDSEFLINSWHSSTRPKSTIRFNPQQQWIGLKIISTKGGTEKDSTGEVTFVARFKINGKATRQEEVSLFQKENDGRWYYVKELL